jgi:hypothetical protein
MKLLSYIFNLFREHPSSHTIDVSGVVWSDYPHGNGNGYNKGWVINIPSRDVVIVCKHANPSTTGKNNEVYVRDHNRIIHRRKIVKIDKAPFGIGATGEYYNGGDIALCKLDRPLPSDVRAYTICSEKSFIFGRKVSTIHQDSGFSSGRIIKRGSAAYLKTRKRTRKLVAGDSGLPWFVWDSKASEWKVISHSFRGDNGEGPWYTMIADEIMTRAQNL